LPILTAAPAFASLYLALRALGNAPHGTLACLGKINPHTQRIKAPQKVVPLFLAGAEGLEPSARGFGASWDSKERVPSFAEC